MKITLENIKFDIAEFILDFLSKYKKFSVWVVSKNMAKKKSL